MNNIGIYIINNTAKEFDLIEKKYEDRIQRFKEQLISKGVNFEIIEDYCNQIELEMKEKCYKEVHWSSWGII